MIGLPRKRLLKLRKPKVPGEERSDLTEFEELVLEDALQRETEERATEEGLLGLHALRGRFLGLLRLGSRGG